MKSVTRRDQSSKGPIRSTCSSCANSSKGNSKAPSRNTKKSKLNSKRQVSNSCNSSSFSVSNEGIRDFGQQLDLKGFGVGKDSELGWFKNVCRTEKPNIVVLQETKMHIVDLNWIHALWGNHNCNFVQKEMVGKSGGQLIIWDTNCFDITNSFISDFCIGIRGLWRNSGKEFNVINVYGPHDDRKKVECWNFLHNKVTADSNQSWIVCGDVNEVRTESERVNCQFIESWAKRFNEFIESSKLIDIPLGGRLFTRISDDGLKFRKLDRFLINDSFHNLWKNLSVVALDRGKSDHCPIILKEDDRNFGPKPIKVFDEWLDMEGVWQIINYVWEEVVHGWIVA
ncbi:uncharacterized protein [Rutidosis leptorrhynchoides]|uniref:uncharacterized protein n=1 Tax=Rutidosis leptorrhynchoides TaxID=125765 RepID=UPI003A9A48A1